jgi:hypothetical protein
MLQRNRGNVQFSALILLNKRLRKKRRFCNAMRGHNALLRVLKLFRRDGFAQ